MIPAAPFLIGLIACLGALWGIKAWKALRAATREQKRGALALLAVLAVLCAIHAQKNAPSITVDPLMIDAGCYATNDVFHVAVSNAPAYAAIDLSTSPVLVYARERASTNAADWAELMPRRLFGELPADYAIANATNYNYLVYLDYVPPSPVHTNGVFELHGFTLDGFSGERAAGFINSKPITLEAE